MTAKTSITRRIFVIGSATIGGLALAGLGVGTGYLATVDVDGMTPDRRVDGSVNLNTWINVAADNTITILAPFLEMGQGTHTGVAQLVAEELGLDLAADNVRVMHPNEEFAAHTNWAMFLNQRPEEMSGPLAWASKRFLGSMRMSATGGSTAVVGSWQAMRQAGAVARELLRTAAAQHLKTDVSDLELEHAAFRSRTGGTTVSFGDLVELAVAIDPPSKVSLKPASEFQVIGKSVPRLDVPAKISGQGQYGIDVRLPDMAFATVKQAPVFGATIRSLNDRPARAMRGVIDVITEGSAAIVVADNTWRAFQAADALEIEYDLPPDPAVSKKLLADMERRTTSGEISQSRDEGDSDKALTASAKTIEALYRTPYLAHATLEPMNCTVWWKSDDAVEVWAPTQSAAMARQVIEAMDGAKSVKVNVTLAGGGFGRRAEKDFVSFAAAAAKAQKGRPVKLVWSRAEDMQHDYYRPAAVARMRAGVGSDGRLTAFDAVVGTQSVMASFLPRNVGMSGGFTADQTTLEGIAHLPYNVNDLRIAASELETPVPMGFWRSVGHSNNAFLVEGMIDECADAVGADPFEFRLANLAADKQRHKHVLETLRELSGWSGKGGDGKGRGVAIHESFRSIVGAVVDVEIDDDKTVRLAKAYAVIDCGMVVNPRLVEAQVQGGLLFGLTATCYGKIDIVDGRVEQENFDSYQMLSLATAPSTEVRIIENTELPGGVGEPGTPPAAPALVNAIFAATGERIRTLPISDAGYSV